MTRLYECMFLIDNDAVRAGWGDAKASVAALVAKHGGSVETARRWDERRLTYPIRHKNRATYLLSYCQLDPTTVAALRRDLDISELCLRYLITSAEEVPAKERDLAAAEEEKDFVVPEPPADDAVDEPVVEERAERPAAESPVPAGANEAAPASAEAAPASTEAAPASAEAAPASTEETPETAETASAEGEPVTTKTAPAGEEA
jgi:ribosomal protein S6